MTNSSQPAANYAPTGRPTTAHPSLWFGRVLLGLVVGYLLFRAWQVRITPFEQVDWRIQHSDEIFDWLRGLIWRELILLVLSFLLGISVPMATGSSAELRTNGNRWLLRALWWFVGIFIITLCFAIGWEELPPLGALALPYAAYLLGVWLSSAAMRGRRALAWATAQFGAILILGVFLALAAAKSAISSEPLPFQAVRMTSVQKQLLAQRLRESKVPEDQPRYIQLRDTEINALLESVLSRGDAERHAEVHFEPSAFNAKASLQLQQRGAEKRYLNVQTAGRVSIKHGQLQFDIDELRIGDLSVPRLILDLVDSAFHTMFMEEPQIQRITDAITELNTQPGTIDVTFQPGSVNRQVIPSLVQLLWKQPDVGFETSEILKHLLAVYETLPSETDRFAKLIEEAFKIAAARSRTHDPALENRAAIFALAIMLGHAEIEPFVGEVLDSAERATVDQIVGQVTLRGRHDLPRHFLVSAALALLSDEATSDRIGLVKEQLDSQSGGSGFSFVDLLANFAGVRFAVAATRDDPSALRWQAKLAGGFDIAELMPPIDNLPENLTEEEFNRDYGGVDGAGYKKVIEEINRRLSALPAP